MRVKKVAVITAGGDAPGMNAALRAIVRMGEKKGLLLFGVKRGYTGLLYNEVEPLNRRSVSGIINLGGTILKTSRCEEIKTEIGLEMAKKTIEYNNFDALIVIGGDGTFRGALDIKKKVDIQIVGVPASIDNDIYGTDETIGFDTAVNTAVRAIDYLRDTAYSHERLFIVKVMGRKRGFIALEVGIEVGAEFILIPEVKEDLNKIIAELKEFEKIGKRSNLMVIAEGYEGADQIPTILGNETKLEVRLSVLGYLQRGGPPTARSRLLAELFGTKAIECLINEEENVMVGIRDNKLETTPLKEAVGKEKEINLELYKLAKELT
ncbi:MAG: ATP-dependent 6-phosphofructokinase [Thermoproteota archaeon]|nr:6-phosphofructokinase [Candidatus Brockarchaeota archaeon]MBO3800821.1 6-phosphofructokinase [Candidatus Brockarchaeota archaeon]